MLLKGTAFEKLSNGQLEQLYHASPIKEKVSLDEDFIIIMLGGDAPDQTEMRCFTKESADVLINRLVYLIGKR